MISDKKPSKTGTWFSNNGGVGKWLYISVLILLAVIFLTIGNIGHKIELRRYGVIVYARMVGSHMPNSKFKIYTADFVYQLNGRTHKAEIDNYDQGLYTGDTVILKCSSRDSSIYDMIGRRIHGKDYKRAGE